MLKAKELRDQTLDELQLLYRDLLKELFEIRNKAQIEKPKETHLTRQKRREIARVLTVIRQKELAA
ncbi:MAG: 50S ribosomal protein L29 [Chlamydiia bacterium]|nr:50S ribosomal protein L29 [Chlamydiia bacterium]